MTASAGAIGVAPRSETVARRGDGAWSTVLWAVYSTRVIVWVAAMVALAVHTPTVSGISGLDPNLFTQPFHATLLDRLVAPAARWDSAWYLEVSTHFYANTPHYLGLQAQNFFPLYPLLIHIATWVFRTPVVAGLVVSMVSMVIALVLLYRLTELELGAGAAKTVVWLMALFPMSLFMSAVYTESLFLMLTIGCIYAARTERWLIAGICGGLAAATRSNGLLLLVPLAIMFLYGPRARPRQLSSPGGWRPRYRLSPEILSLGLVPLGTGLYMLYLQLAYGTPLEPFKAQEQFWGHHFAGPFGAVVNALSGMGTTLSDVLHHTGPVVSTGDPISWQGHELIDFAFVLLSVPALIICARRLPIAYTAYSLVSMCLVLSVPTVFEQLQSYDRYSLSIFPLFMAVAAPLSRHRRTRWALFAVSAVLLGGFSYLWGQWDWIA
jgi:hypothetical protein